MCRFWEKSIVESMPLPQFPFKQGDPGSPKVYKQGDLVNDKGNKGTVSKLVCGVYYHLLLIHINPCKQREALNWDNISKSLFPFRAT